MSDAFLIWCGRCCLGVAWLLVAYLVACGLRWLTDLIASVGGRDDTEDGL